MSSKEPDGQGLNPEAFVSGVAYPTPFREYAVALCGQASRHICVLSPRLDHTVFDSAELSEALSALARRSRQTEVRILVQDPREMVSRGHRLLQLARRLPSTIKLQVLAEHPDWQGQTVVIKDRNGVLYQPQDGDNSAFFEPDSRASAQRHIELFDALWRYSVQDPQLRALHL